MRLSEANHRIANSLAAIAGIVRLQAQDDERVSQLRSPLEVKQFLNEVGTRIETASHLHRLLTVADATQMVDLASYLAKVAKSVLASNRLGDNVSMIYDLGPRCAISSSRALSVGLIVGELVTNSLKYAHPAGVRGQIVFGCRRDGENIIIEVADDGVGLPEGFDANSGASLGFKLITKLSTQIGARFRIYDEGLGVRATLTFKAI